MRTCLLGVIRGLRASSSTRSGSPRTLTGPGNTPSPPRTSTMPLGEPVLGIGVGDRATVVPHHAAVGEHQPPRSVLSSVDLPDPLVPTRATVSPVATSSSHPNSTLHPTVGAVERPRTWTAGWSVALRSPTASPRVSSRRSAATSAMSVLHRTAGPGATNAAPMIAGGAAPRTVKAVRSTPGIAHGAGRGDCRRSHPSGTRRGPDEGERLTRAGGAAPRPATIGAVQHEGRRLGRRWPIGVAPDQQGRSRRNRRATRTVNTP